MKPKTFFYVLIGVCGALLIIGAIGYFFGIKMLTAKKQELVKKEANLKLIEERSIQLVELRRRYDEAAKRLDEITRALPESKQQAEVIVALKDIANRAGLDLPSIQFASSAGGKTKIDPNFTQTSKVGELYVLPISLKMTGSYDQLVSFLSEAERLSRYNSVISLNLVKIATNRERLDISLTINAYLKP